MEKILFMMVPEIFYPVLIVISGIMMIIGFRRLSLALLGAVLLKAFFGPITRSFLHGMPPWVLALVFLIFALYVISLIWGKRAAEKTVSNVFIAIIQVPFKLIGWLIRGVRP
jgi:hypothetical protein